MKRKFKQHKIGLDITMTSDSDSNSFDSVLELDSPESEFFLPAASIVLSEG